MIWKRNKVATVAMMSRSSTELVVRSDAVEVRGRRYSASSHPSISEDDCGGAAQLPASQESDHDKPDKRRVQYSWSSLDAQAGS